MRCALKKNRKGREGGRQEEKDKLLLSRKEGRKEGR
jgi:hypothetical protein